jgi:hypothetical protein
MRVERGLGSRLTVPFEAGTVAGEVEIEPGHLERLVRTAAHVAIGRGLLGPSEETMARVVPGTVRARHGPVACLQSCRVELTGSDGEPVAVEFGRDVFGAFAVARAVHLLGDTVRGPETAVRYSLHAVAGDDEPCRVAPGLPVLSLDSLAVTSSPSRQPDGDWIVTFMTPAVLSGLADLVRESRSARLEVAGRIHTRVGFDPARSCFVRVLEDLVISRGTEATTLSVRSTAASWGAVLGERHDGQRRTISSVHSHLHLDTAEEGSEGASGNDLLVPGGLPSSHATCISIADVVTHYVHFPDPLAAALIVSIFPDTCVVSLYGYTAGALLREEPGWWVTGKERFDARQAS